MGSSSIKYKRAFKPSCPFGRRCFSDGSICGFIGSYAECPPAIDDKSTDVAPRAILPDVARRLRRNG